MRLLHPEIADRSCSECQEFLYHDTPTKMGLPVIRNGRHEKRGNTPPPCRWCPKIPPSVPPKEVGPDKAIELSERNFQAFQHHLICRAVGRFPVDPWVERNAMIIRAVMDDADQKRQDERVLGMARQMMSMVISSRAS